MYILGDIGNSETKIFLVNSKNKILKNINIPTNQINSKILRSNFKKIILDLKKIDKILFCSVVPKYFDFIKKFLSQRTNVKCHEVKNLSLKSLINIKVNFKQVGSDRLTNAISLLNNKDNFIILDLGTATTFDVIIKKTYLGGIIAPGVKISLNKIQSITDKDIKGLSSLLKTYKAKAIIVRPDRFILKTCKKVKDFNQIKSLPL